MEHQFSDEARRQWFADKEAKRDAALESLAIETDPKMQRKLRASARRYKAVIAMGPERTRAASSHPAIGAQCYPLAEIKQRGFLVQYRAQRQGREANTNRVGSAEPISQTCIPATSTCRL